MKWLVSVTAVLLLALPLRAQVGASINGQVISPYGLPVPAAELTVCPYTATGKPCSPQQQIYQDVNLTVPLTQPYASDQYGNYNVFVTPGTYLVQVLVSPGVYYSATITVNASGSGNVGGSGAAGYLPLWTASTIIGNSLADYGVTNAGVFTFRAPILSSSQAGVNAINPPTPTWVLPSYQQSVALPVQAVFNGISTLTQPYPFYAPRNINALFTATGQNLGQTPVGPGGWSEHEPDSMYATNNAPGWLINFHTLTQAAPGDFADRYVNMTWYLGMQAGTDEGAHVDGGGISEPTVTYTGTITSGGSAGTTSLKVNCTVDCNNPGDNRQMLDTSQVVLTGTITSHTNETATSPEIYGISIATGSMPNTTAIGTLVSACGPSSSQWPVGQQTVTVSCPVTVSSGTFAVNDWVTFSTNFHEVAQVTAVTALSGGQQTLTFNLRHAHAAGPVYANGCAGCYVVFTANLGNGTLKYPITVVSGTSSTMLTVPFVEASTLGAGLVYGSYSGNVSTASGQNAFTIYRGAEVLDVQDASNNYAIDGTFGVEPTPTTWNSGDTIEIEHEPTFTLLARDLHVTIQNPGAVGGAAMGGWAGYTTWLNGSGMVGEGYGNFFGDINASKAAFAAENQESYTNYHSVDSLGSIYQPPPSFLRANGLFDAALEMQVMPLHGIFSFGQPANSSTAPIPILTLTNYNATATHTIIYNPQTNTVTHPSPETFNNPNDQSIVGSMNAANGSIGALSSGAYQNFVESSNEWTSTGWTASATAVTTNTTDVTDPRGNNTATKLVFSTGGYMINNSTYSAVAGTAYNVGVWVRVASGTAGIELGVQGVANPLPVSANWTYVQTTVTPAAGQTGIFLLGYQNSPFTLYVWTANTSLASNLIAGAYDTGAGNTLQTLTYGIQPAPLVSTGGGAYVPTINANSGLTANDVVTTENTTGQVQDSGTALSSLCQSNGTNCPAQHGSVYGETPSLTSISGSALYSPRLLNVSGTLANITGIAASFTCTGNPTITLEDCGTSTACGSPTALASVTLTASNTITAGTVSSSTLTSGHYLAWEVSAGTCTALQISATAAY